jgi:hypothetical protein
MFPPEINVEDTPLAGTACRALEDRAVRYRWLTGWLGVPDLPNRGRVQAESFQPPASLST